MAGSESDLAISPEELERRKRQRSTTPDDRRTRCPACGSPNVVAQLHSPHRPVPRTADYSCRRCGEAFDVTAVESQFVTDGGGEATDHLQEVRR